METERFEALIDAILAIIITIIVLELPLANVGSWEALYELRYDFLIYAVSFIVCFNFWNFNNNIFRLVNKVDNKVIWTMGITLFVFSLLPYLTLFVGEHFYLFLALSKHYPMYTTITTVLIGMILGYIFYPPIILVCCLISILGVWFIPRIIFHFK